MNKMKTIALTLRIDISMRLFSFCASFVLNQSEVFNNAKKDEFFFKLLLYFSHILYNFKAYLVDFKI
jgi:hypothetical protein